MVWHLDSLACAEHCPSKSKRSSFQLQAVLSSRRQQHLLRIQVQLVQEIQEISKSPTLHDQLCILQVHTGGKCSEQPDLLSPFLLLAPLICLTASSKVSKISLEGAREVKRVCLCTTSALRSNIAERSSAALMSWNAFMPATLPPLTPGGLLGGLSACNSGPLC